MHMYICQICKKAPATIHLTDIHNNVKKEVHICETCAAEKGFNLQGASNLPQLLGLAAKKGMHLSPQAAQAKGKAKAAENDLVCLQCGTTWSQFSERGRLGCPHDYKAFEKKMRPLIAGQIAQGTKNAEKFHVGKRPGGRSEPDETGMAMRNLEKKLRAAVAEENYEAAARFKNELDELRRRETGEGGRVDEA